MQNMTLNMQFGVPIRVPIDKLYFHHSEMKMEQAENTKWRRVEDEHRNFDEKKSKNYVNRP